ncbi:MAG: hypothetical protein P4L03_01045 [Terracidiphilus sp.]|nr:hypothetical protein [Terracidiphilus sp.]
MNIERMLAPVAAPLATGFVLLVLYLSAGVRPAPVGLPLIFYHVTSDSLAWHPCDRLSPLLQLGADHKVRVINYDEEIPRDQLRKRVREMSEYNVMRPFYVTLDPSLSYGEGMQFLSEVRSATPGLHVILIAGGIRQYSGFRPVPCGVYPFWEPGSAPADGLLVWLSLPPNPPPPIHEELGPLHSISSGVPGR